MLNDRSALALLVLVLIVGSALSYLLYAGPYYAFDDHIYIDYAHQIQTGSYSLIKDTPYSFGYFFTSSIALSFDLFGASTLSAVLPQFVEYLVLIIISFLVGRTLYGNSMGVFSAFLAATAPSLVGYSTRVFPDLLLGVVASLAVYTFLLANKTKRKLLWYFVTGALASLTIYVKLTGVAFMLLLVIASLFLLFFKRRKTEPVANNGSSSLDLEMDGRQFLAMLAGMVLFFFINLLTVYIATGNPFYTLQNYGRYQSMISMSSLGNNISTMIALLFGYYTVNAPYGALAFIYTAPLGGIIFLALIGTCLGLLRRERNITFAAILFWGVFFYLLFGTISLSNYSFAVVYMRYFALMIAPLALLGSYSAIGLVTLFGRRFKKNGPTIVITLATLLAILPNIPIYWTFYNYDSIVAADSSILHSVLSYIGNNNGSVINLATGDSDSADYLSFLSGYSKRFNITTLNITHTGILESQMASLCNAQHGSYVAIVYTNLSRLDYLIVNEDWPYTTCSLTRIAFFNNKNASKYGIFENYSIYALLYKVQNK